MIVDLNGRTFRGTDNYDNGDFDKSVRFYFAQRATVVSANFEGRRIAFGVLLGTIAAEGSVSGHWLYLNIRHEPVLGVFESTIEWNEAGRIVLREHWASLSPGVPRLGFSTIEEV